MPTRPFGQPFADQRGLGRCIVIHDEMDVEFSRYGGLDLVEELAKLGGSVASIAFAVTRPVAQGGEQPSDVVPYPL